MEPHPQVRSSDDTRFDRRDLHVGPALGRTATRALFFYLGEITIYVFEGAEIGRQVEMGKKHPKRGRPRSVEVFPAAAPLGDAHGHCLGILFFLQLCSLSTAVQPAQRETEEQSKARENGRRGEERGKTALRKPGARPHSSTRRELDDGDTESRSRATLPGTARAPLSAPRRVFASTRSYEWRI
jgi:hypothetical protein